MNIHSRMSMGAHPTLPKNKETKKPTFISDSQEFPVPNGHP